MARRAAQNVEECGRQRRDGPRHLESIAQKNSVRHYVLLLNLTAPVGSVVVCPSLSIARRLDTLLRHDERHTTRPALPAFEVGSPPLGRRPYPFGEIGGDGPPGPAVARTPSANSAVMANRPCSVRSRAMAALARAAKPSRMASRMLRTARGADAAISAAKRWASWLTSAGWTSRSSRPIRNASAP